MRRWVLSVLTLGLLSLGTGCQKGLQAERDSLFVQNQEFKKQLETDKLQLDACNRERQQLRASLEKAAQTPPPAETPAVAAAPAPATETGNTADFEKIEGTTVSRSKRGETTISIGGDVLFESGKAKLKPAAEKTLAKLAKIIKAKYPQQLIRVEGHTDSQPVRKSGWDDNWDLGASRARSVTLYLLAQGISKKNIYIASFADNQPKSESKIAANRRVEVVLVK